ncbi:MAG: zinc ABC transporter substrate-binding protein [Actinobacteria bacterium]|nr:zinc ABC transporter substrate-binding protein [Actinomycetota bacterium]
MSMVLMKKLISLFSLIVILVGCSSTETPEQVKEELPQIVTGAFPIAWLSSQLAGDCAVVNDLTPAGGDVHDLELTPAQTAAIIDADLIISVSGFQISFDDAVANTTADVLDLLPLIDPILGETHSHNHSGETDHDHEGETDHEKSSGEESLDPHFWLDPNRAITAANLIKEVINTLSDDCATETSDNYQSLVQNLTQIDVDYRDELSQCQSKTMVVSHEAFGYLAKAYDLEQIAVAGLDPESEPSAARISEIIAIAKEKKVSAVFTEDNANPAVADILAKELKVGVLVLNPIELKPASLDYLTEMQQNLLNLSQGLGCR